MLVAALNRWRSPGSFGDWMVDLMSCGAWWGFWFFPKIERSFQNEKCLQKKKNEKFFKKWKSQSNLKWIVIGAMMRLDFESSGQTVEKAKTGGWVKPLDSWVSAVADCGCGLRWTVGQFGKLSLRWEARLESRVKVWCSRYGFWYGIVALKQCVLKALPASRTIDKPPRVAEV